MERRPGVNANDIVTEDKGISKGGKQVIRTADEGWVELTFFQKLNTCTMPMRWFVLLPPLLSLYGCLFYVMVDSTVYYGETNTIRPFLFPDAFMLVLLIVLSIGILLSAIACILLFLFKRQGITMVNAVFMVYLAANLFWLCSTLFHPWSFFTVSLYASLLSLVFLGMMFYWNIRYFWKRIKLFH